MAGEREALLAAMGIMPDYGPEGPPAMAPAMPMIKDGATVASENAARFRDIVSGVGAKLVAPSDPVRSAAASPFNPLAVAAGRAAAGSVAKDMGPGRARDALEYAAGEPFSREMKSFVRTHDADPPTAPLRQMSTDVEIQPAPTLQERARAAVAHGAGLGTPGFGGLRGKLEASQGAMLKGYDDAADLQRELGIDKALAAQGRADLQEQNAARMQRDAEEQQRIDADATARHQAFLARQEKLADDIAKERPDPRKLLSDADLGEQLTYGMGMALGQMFGNGTNPYADRIEKILDRDFKRQIEAKDSKIASYNARQSLFGQMLAETGDRRLAAMQARKLTYDAMDLKYKADADRLGIPELRDNAAILGQELERKRQALQVDIDALALKNAQAAAAAAAAAQRAAEERAWQHQMDLVKLDQEQQKINNERGKAGGDLNKQTQQLGEKLGDKDLAEGRAAVDAAKRRLMGLKPDEGLPGVGPVADARAGLHPKSAGDLLLGGATGYAADKVFGLSDAERVSRGDWEKIKLAYQKQITGSGASEGERKMLTQAFEGARSPAEQRNAIQQADDYFSRREAAIKAGYDPNVVKLYEERQNAIRPQLPDGAKERR